eukprot:CAMPEP_0168316492 /NCGR_PEP_ID=MMETSP0210-20121227/15896_1 /TAXON_ID=40633 /ORGANISM="Condylostoma magnum, Strain COL2" /LENGTH=106 /DNA_ID=CAMNT_0008297905 /DNA_START=349 /DNA_END=669 /DNA_ORIENTATION=+
MLTFDSEAIADEVAREAGKDDEINEEQLKWDVMDMIYLGFTVSIVIGAFITSLCFFCALKYYRATKKLEAFIAGSSMINTSYIQQVPAQPGFGNVQYVQPGNTFVV